MTRRRIHAGGVGRPVVAVPKGAMYQDALHCLTGAGYDTNSVLVNERKQLFVDERIMTMRPSDVATYVAEGAADIGIVGKDVIVESALGTSLYELVDLKFGGCRMSLATIAGDRDPVWDSMQRLGVARIGTKYPRSTFQWAEATGRSVDIIELKGSVELAAVSGLTDGIVDLVDTGRTLAENGLVERAQLWTSTARLIANPVSYAQQGAEIDRLASALEHAAKERR